MPSSGRGQPSSRQNALHTSRLSQAMDAQTQIAQARQPLTKIRVAPQFNIVQLNTQGRHEHRAGMQNR